MILFFGPAGAGKGVQGEKLASRMNWEWLSSGQLLRESGDPEITAILQEGKLVPLEKFGQLFADAVKKASNVTHLILDGFPRKREQVEWLVAHEPELGRSIKLAIVIDVPKEELLNRMQQRGRADDTPEAISMRLDIYHQEIDPILSYLDEHQIPVVHINGVGSIDDIHEDVMKEIRAHHLA